MENNIKEEIKKEDLISEKFYRIEDELIQVKNISKSIIFKIYGEDAKEEEDKARPKCILSELDVILDIILSIKKEINRINNIL